MFKQIACKICDNVCNVYFVNIAQIKCVEINKIEGKERCFNIHLQFGEGCNISCSGFIIGEYEAIGRFLNGEDSRLFIDSTKL